MKIIAYPLYAQAPDLQPAAALVDADRSENSTWLKSDQAHNLNLALADAQRQGWQLLCPVAFRATWNGGPNPEDVAIELVEATIGQAGDSGTRAATSSTAGMARTPIISACSAATGKDPCKISVILPAANESVLLQRTVEQFAATLPDDSEIIVVDNGSTDGCSDFLLEHCPENIRLIRTPDALGVAGARNRGLAQPRGEFIADQP